MIGAAEFCVPTQADTPTENLPATTPRPVGRPRIYNEETAFTLLDLIGAGGKLHEVCERDDMPSAATVYRWIADNQGFCLAYHCALMAKFDMKSEECIVIVDEAAKGVPVGKSGDEVVAPLKEALLFTQMRLDERHRQMAKELPRKYGEMAVLPAPPPAPLVGEPGDNATVVNHHQEVDPVERAILEYLAQDDDP